MTKTPRWLTVIVSVLLLALLVLVFWGIVKIWLLFWAYISHAEPTIGAAIIAGSFTVIVPVVSVVVGRIFERNKELAQRRWEKEQELRKQYIPVYQELIEFLFKVFTGTKTGNVMQPDELSQFFASFTQKILVWGSDSFIKNFSEFHDSSAVYAEKVKDGTVTDDDLIYTMEKLERLLYSIRNDFGHDNKILGKGDLLTLFITDVRTYIPKQLVGSQK